MALYGQLLGAMVVLLGLTLISCVESGDPRDQGGSAQPTTVTSLVEPAPKSPSAQPTTVTSSVEPSPKPPSAQLTTGTPTVQPRPTPLPKQRETAVQTVEPLATPPPLPRLSIEYDGRTYYGRQGSYCWPVSVDSSVCAERVRWMGFDGAPSLVVNQGDEVSVSVESDESSVGQVMAQVLKVESTVPVVTLGEEVYSVPAAGVMEINLPPDVYFLHAFYKSPLGDVSYEFKLEVVE